MITDTHVIVPVFGWFPGVVSHIRSIRAYSPGAVVHLLHDGIAIRKLEEVRLGVDASACAGSCTASFERFINAKQCPTSSFHHHCFARHFAVCDYARAKKLPRFWYFDWDVLVMFDLALESERLKNACGLRGNGNFLVNDLDAFTDYIESWATHSLITSPNGNPGDLDVERAIWSTPGGNEWIDACVPQDDGSIYDDNLACSNNFDLIEGPTQPECMKRLAWRWNERLAYPHAFHKPTQQWLRMKTLHCWGVHKGRMDQYLKLGQTKPL